MIPPIRGQSVPGSAVRIGAGAGVVGAGAGVVDGGAGVVGGGAAVVVGGVVGAVTVKLPLSPPMVTL